MIRSQNVALQLAAHPASTSNSRSRIDRIRQQPQRFLLQHSTSLYARFWHHFSIMFADLWCVSYIPPPHARLKSALPVKDDRMRLSAQRGRRLPILQRPVPHLWLGMADVGWPIGVCPLTPFHSVLLLSFMASNHVPRSLSPASPAPRSVRGVRRRPEAMPRMRLRLTHGQAFASARGSAAQSAVSLGQLPPSMASPHGLRVARPGHSWPGVRPRSRCQ